MDSNELRKKSSLTGRQGQILREIRLSMKLYSRAPTYSQMCTRMGIRSKKTVAYFLLQLQEKGYIKIKSGEHRGITLTGKAIGYLEKRDMLQLFHSKIDGKTYLVSVIGEVSSSENKEMKQGNDWGLVPPHGQGNAGTVFQSVQFAPLGQNENLKLVSKNIDFSASNHRSQRRQNQDNEDLPVEFFFPKASSTNINVLSNIVFSFNAKLEDLFGWLKKKGIF